MLSVRTIGHRIRFLLKKGTHLKELRHADPEVRLGAMFQLRSLRIYAHVKGKSLCDPFIVLLRDGDPAVQESAASELGEIRATKAVGPLCEAIKSSSNGEFCRTALWALTELGAADQAFEFVKSKLQALGAEHIRHPLLCCVEKLAYPTEAVPVMLMVMGKTTEAVERRGLTRAFAHFEKRAREDGLTEACQSSNPTLRAAAVEALGSAKEQDCLPVVQRALGDSEAIVRAAALDAIASIGSGTANEAVVKLLEDADPDVRRAAVRAAGSLKVYDAIPLMTQVLRTAPPSLCEAIAMALSDLDARSSAPAIEAALQRMRSLSRARGTDNLLDSADVLSAAMQLEFAWKKLGVRGYH